MSWDKNTINASHLNSVKEVLDDLKAKYTLEVKEKVHGMGLNDDEDKIYELRRLSYCGFVILERIYQTLDCDADDVITSHKFTQDNEPEDWLYIIKEKE
jgi:hypothetical protein